MQPSNGNVTNGGEWVTTRQAAEALHIKPRQVRGYISGGELEARTEGEGANKRYFVSMTSIEELRLKREAEGKLPGQEAADLARELTGRLEEAGYRLGRAEARLELAVQAESALRDQLRRERERAERLEAERDRLVPDLLRERDLANAQRERAEHFEAELREALEARRGWFRRFFGF